MVKLENRDSKFDKNRIDKLIEINRLIKIIDKSLRVELGGFLTFYTEKIQDLSYIPTLTDVREKIKLSEEIKTKRILQDRQQILFWDSFDYYYHNSKNFKTKADKILSKLFVNNKKCFCNGDKDFKPICKECNDAVVGIDEGGQDAK